MDILDLIAKYTPLLLTLLVIPLRDIFRKLNENASKIGGIYGKLDKLDEHQSREHKDIARRMERLEDQHCAQNVELARLGSKDCNCNESK